jgi:hypothetical protein
MRSGSCRPGGHDDECSVVMTIYANKILSNNKIPNAIK